MQVGQEDSRISNISKEISSSARLSWRGLVLSELCSKFNIIKDFVLSETDRPVVIRFTLWTCPLHDSRFREIREKTSSWEGNRKDRADSVNKLKGWNSLYDTCSPCWIITVKIQTNHYIIRPSSFYLFFFLFQVKDIKCREKQCLPCKVCRENA